MQRLRSRVWYVSISCPDPKDNYVMIVQAITDFDAGSIATIGLKKDQHIDRVDATRPKKKNALRKRKTKRVNRLP